VKFHKNSQNQKEVIDIFVRHIDGGARDEVSRREVLQYACKVSEAATAKPVQELLYSAYYIHTYNMHNARRISEAGCTLLRNDI